MKNLKLLFAGLLISLIASSQAGQINQVNIVNFAVKNTLPATVDSWLSTPGALVLTAQKVPGAQVREPLMVVQIRGGGGIVCGNNMSTAKRIDPFDVRVFNTAELLGTLGNCSELKAGTYTICVQFFNIDKVAISRELCKEFKVEDVVIEYAPSSLIIPDNGKNFSATELMQPIQFRWTPLVPKPKEPVTYRLRVWQLMQGQNGTAAMKSNTPVVDKEIKEITQATVTGILTGPCKPPYLCDFIWNVQAQNRDGKPMGRNNGMSESWSFGVKHPTKITLPDLIAPGDGKNFSTNELMQPIEFRWTPLVPKPKEPVTYKLRVWQLMQGQNGTAAMRSNKPLIEKDVTDVTQATVTGILTGPCKPPYLCDFIWSVQAMDREGNPLGENEGTSKSWSFGATSPAVAEPLSLTAPDNGKNFSANELAQAIEFRWTPLVPKPKEPVTYRLRVWQLMQGQNGTAAMRSNKPLVEKDVTDITQATVAGLYTGPCKPPYLCDFIWNVQAMNRDGKPLGENDGTSKSWSFGATSPALAEPITLIAPEDGKNFSPNELTQSIEFRWTPLVPKPQEPVTYKLKVWQLMQGQNGTAAMRSNKPLIEKDVTDVTQATVTGILTGPCKPPYLCDFIWSVQAMDREGNPLGENEGTSKSWSFGATSPALAESITLIAPDDGKNFSPNDLTQAVEFRWTPLVPKPKEPVTYKLKVWQLMQGQNGTQAMRSNKPLIEKDVTDATQATVSGILTGPCKPPYLCDFIWTVQAMDRDGKPVGENNGTSKSWSFGATSPAVAIAPPQNLFPEKDKRFSVDEAKEGIKFQWTADSSSQNEPVTYKLRVWQLMQGQNGTQAMRSNKPLVEKDVTDATQATVAGLYTGPCKPPYLCDFIWSVQAINRDGKPVGNNNGTSVPTMLFVSQ